MTDEELAALRAASQASVDASRRLEELARARLLHGPANDDVLNPAMEAAWADYMAALVRLRILQGTAPRIAELQARAERAAIDQTFTLTPTERAELEAWRLKSEAEHAELTRRIEAMRQRWATSSES